LKKRTISTSILIVPMLHLSVTHNRKSSHRPHISYRYCTNNVSYRACKYGVFV